MIINNFSNIFGWFKRNFNLIAVIIIGVFTAIFCFQINQLEKKNAEIDRLDNNILFYLELNDSALNQNTLLKLTINELKHSKDTIIQHLNDVRKELKIKDKELNLALSQKQEIKLDTTIIVKENNFKLYIKPNSLTTIYILKEDSILTAKLNIQNQLTLFITSKREYKNKYKNWFCRLFNFDFKKRNVHKYSIINSNELIKTTDTRVIQLNDK